MMAVTTETKSQCLTAATVILENTLSTGLLLCLKLKQAE